MNLITWNMQGATSFGESKWHTDVPRLFAANAQILCLQECGEPPPSAVPAAPPAWIPGPPGLQWRYLMWNLGTHSRPQIVYILWLETDPVGHRVNLAIAVSAAAAAPINLLGIPNGAGGRPAIGLRFPYLAGTYDIYTLHAQSGNGGADAPNLITNIVATGAANWFAPGDFNRSPTLTWNPPAAPGIGVAPVPAGAVLCPHNGTITHPGSGTNLDYAFRGAGGGLAPNPAINGNVFTGFVVSDHYPVGYILD